MRPAFFALFFLFLFVCLILLLLLLLLLLHHHHHHHHHHLIIIIITIVQCCKYFLSSSLKTANIFHHLHLINIIIIIVQCCKYFFLQGMRSGHCSLWQPSRTLFFCVWWNIPVLLGIEIEFFKMLQIFFQCCKYFCPPGHGFVTLFSVAAKSSTSIRPRGSLTSR